VKATRCWGPGPRSARSARRSKSANRPFTAGDADSDGDIDYFDLFWFELCFSGAGIDSTTPGCGIMDYDDDNDVDLVDFGTFKLDFTGPLSPNID
jgi:hypothetical protein